MASRRRSVSPTSGITASPSVTRIVNKLALEGKSKSNGASVKLYLKARSLSSAKLLPYFEPLALYTLRLNITGNTNTIISRYVTYSPYIALSMAIHEPVAEESLKIVDSVVHPIDHYNVPFAFSNSSLLQASRALNLPNRSSKSYLSLFPHLSPDRVLDERLIGHISIVDFQVTYILPKELPPKIEERLHNPSARSSDTLNFIAALDMVLPFRSVPPTSPFTVCCFQI
jgi:hypothetical protein